MAIRQSWRKRESRAALSIAIWNYTSNRVARWIKPASQSGGVEGIVCIDEYEVEIHGFANHAGTTPMPERHNALLAAAKLIEAVEETVTRDPGRQVGTVGHLEVWPNTRNVVPGVVKHSIELRDLSPEKIARAQGLGAAGKPPQTSPGDQNAQNRPSPQDQLAPLNGILQQLFGR